MFVHLTKPIIRRSIGGPALWACLFAAVAADPVPAAETPAAQATLLVGRVWTGDAQRPWAEAVAVRGERLVAVGARDEVAVAAGAEARVIDAGDGLIVPGLIDTHIHLIEGGRHLTSVQLRAADSRE